MTYHAFKHTRPKKVFVYSILFGCAFGIWAELRGVLSNHWDWHNLGPSLLGLPFTVYLAYILASLAIVASVLVCRNKYFLLLNRFNFLIMILFAAGHYFYINDPKFLFIAFSIIFFSIAVRRGTHTLIIAYWIAMIDNIIERFFMAEGLVNYIQGYDGVLYMGVFFGALLVATFTDALAAYFEKSHRADLRNL